ncbi:MAG: Fic family protein [Polaromonas sp.]|uniref:Fic family protein n=2 Tax=Polaromonas sp. TaxID=1869339 RepID=UPI0027205F76|nr:Fic family protein [Polaromonas sp.]MDO9115631.1 Fic family protein [Polaromonas sp.]MDP1886798.1 Fic family protein [Polaromonas sp.]MDP3616028.1 Fic family protein [Rubrivivax sp.]
MATKSQVFELHDDPSQMEPLLPGELRQGPLLERAHDLRRAADQLAGLCRPGALGGLRLLLRAMNSYYSNKIEGQHTLPLEIEQALRNDYSHDQDKARRQRLAVAHMATEQRLEAQWQNWTMAQVWSAQMVRDIHQDLFARLPEGDRAPPKGELLVPGVLRDCDVSVGVHAAPSHKAIGGMLERWGGFYGAVRRGELQIAAAAASHHRLAWIHPFRDGNGRVARLHTHLVLGKLGLTNGLWSPLRGFARSHEAYYARLAAADEPRAGDLDGRGNLSERALVEWMAYTLELCLDQVYFMTGLLDLAGMKDRIAACLAFEEQVLKQGVRAASLRGLHYLFATQSELERSEFKAMLGLGDRLATAQVSALIKRGLLVSDSPYGKLRFGVPQHALRFYFPKLWPEAEAGATP